MRKARHGKGQDRVAVGVVEGFSVEAVTGTSTFPEEAVEGPAHSLSPALDSLAAGRFGVTYASLQQLSDTLNGEAWS